MDLFTSHGRQSNCQIDQMVIWPTYSVLRTQYTVEAGVVVSVELVQVDDGYSFGRLDGLCTTHGTSQKLIACPDMPCSRGPPFAVVAPMCSDELKSLEWVMPASNASLLPIPGRSGARPITPYADIPYIQCCLICALSHCCLPAQAILIYRSSSEAKGEYQVHFEP